MKCWFLMFEKEKVDRLELSRRRKFIKIMNLDLSESF